MKHLEQSPNNQTVKAFKKYICIRCMYYYVRHKYTVSTKA